MNASALARDYESSFGLDHDKSKTKTIEDIINIEAEDIINLKDMKREFEELRGNFYNVFPSTPTPPRYYAGSTIFIPASYSNPNLQKFQEIEKEARQRILSKNEDWEEDEDWPDYEEKTLEYALSFIKKMIGLKSEEATKVVIWPASGGSIDLRWKEEKFEFLINFSPNGSMDYYGHDYNENIIRGFNPNINHIVCWMKHINKQ